MASKSNKELIDILSNLITQANKNSAGVNLKTQELGKCEWVDVDNNSRCNDHWSEFQCAQVSGTFSQGEICEPE